MSSFTSPGAHSAEPNRALGQYKTIRSRSKLPILLMLQGFSSTTQVKTMACGESITDKKQDRSQPALTLRFLAGESIVPPYPGLPSPGLIEAGKEGCAPLPWLPPYLSSLHLLGPLD